MSEPRVFHAENHADLARCFPVMRELRLHLRTAEEFAARVGRQRAEGFTWPPWRSAARSAR